MNDNLEKENYHINSVKWINSLSKSKKLEKEKYYTNSNKWTDSLPNSKKNNFNIIYYMTIIIFISGLIFISTIKNKTRNFQKEINNLEASITTLTSELHKATLDYEFITSPENIENLANEYLSTEFIHYKKFQVSKLNDKKFELNNLKKKQFIKTESKGLKNKMQLKVKKIIKEKKSEIQKFKEMYENPETIPNEIKLGIAKKIEDKKKGLQKFYESPKDLITLERVQRWSVVQLVKLFLGIPIVPGR